MKTNKKNAADPPPPTLPLDGTHMSIVNIKALTESECYSTVVCNVNNNFPARAVGSLAPNLVASDFYKRTLFKQTL